MPSLPVRCGDRVLLCGPGSSTAWPVAAMAIISYTARLAMADFEEVMENELRALLPDERQAVVALVNKWRSPAKKKPRTFMYITYFSAVVPLECHINLYDPYYEVQTPYCRACNSLPVLAGAGRVLHSYLSGKLRGSLVLN